MSPFELCYRDDTSTASDRPKQLVFKVWGVFSLKGEAGGEKPNPFHAVKAATTICQRTTTEIWEGPTKGPRKTTVKPCLGAGSRKPTFMFVREQAAVAFTASHPHERLPCGTYKGCASSLHEE